MKRCSICGRAWFRGDHDTCKRRQRTAARAVEERAQRDFYKRTGSCGSCGQPGTFCLCDEPCGCSELHECGSGRAADPTEVFADAPVIDGQETLL